MNGILQAMLYGALAVWIFWALARLQAAWETSQRQTSELRQALTAAGLRLLGDLETIEKLERETTRVKESAAAAIREQAERHQTVARSTRPPPAEISVTSEYPTSQKDKAWIVEFVRDGDSPRQPWERAPTTSLLWAPTQSTAVARGRQMADAYKTFSVASVRPLAS
jgi:hypothetical protein